MFDEWPKSRPHGTNIQSNPIQANNKRNSLRPNHISLFLSIHVFNILKSFKETHLLFQKNQTDLYIFILF